jgi:hypothetical protein
MVRKKQLMGDGGWWMADEMPPFLRKHPMADGRWQMADGGWERADERTFLPPRPELQRPASRESAAGSSAPEGRQKLSGGVSHRIGAAPSIPPRRVGGRARRTRERPISSDVAPGLCPIQRPSGTPFLLAGEFRWLTPPANFHDPSGAGQIADAKFPKMPRPSSPSSFRLGALGVLAVPSLSFP